MLCSWVLGCDSMAMHAAEVGGCAHERFAHELRHDLLALNPCGRCWFVRSRHSSCAVGLFMSTTPNLLRFDAFTLSLTVIRRLRPVLDAIRAHDRGLEKQLRSAASSVSLNLAESRGRTGKDRLHFLRIALGSAEESAASLYVAEAWGYVTSDDFQSCMDELSHLLAILGKLTRR